MSDTPETDALVEDMGMGCEMVDAWFARKLERERDEAIVSRKASAAEWLINVEQANARTTRALQQTVLAERERDEAREALEHMKRERQNFHEAWKKFCNQFLEATK